MFYDIYTMYIYAMRKNIDLSDECVEALTIEAVKKKTKFKLHAQEILETAAKKSKQKVNRKK